VLPSFSEHVVVSPLCIHTVGCLLKETLTFVPCVALCLSNLLTTFPSGSSPPSSSSFPSKDDPFFLPPFEVCHMLMLFVSFFFSLFQMFLQGSFSCVFVSSFFVGWCVACGVSFLLCSSNFSVFLFSIGTSQFYADSSVCAILQ